MEKEVILEYNANKTTAVRELGKADISVLKEKVLLLSPDEWDWEEDFIANYNKDQSLQQTRHIVFRFANKRVALTEYFALSRWNSWKDVLMPVMEQVTRDYGYVNGFYPKVMLANVPPGCIIPSHIDGGSRGSAPHKIHVALHTNPDSFFYVLPNKYHFEEGYAYEVNNGAYHSVINNGKTDRIHLLFEYLDFDRQPEALKAQMLKSL